MKRTNSASVLFIALAFHGANAATAAVAIEKTQPLVATFSDNLKMLRTSTVYQLTSFEASKSSSGPDTIKIEIDAGDELASHPEALAAFRRGASQWSKRIQDAVTVTIEADLTIINDPETGLPSERIIGSAGSVQLSGMGFDEVRDLIVADAADESDDRIVASLPTADEFTLTLPPGIRFGNDIAVTKANLKALGVTDLDDDFGLVDARITFNSNFRFDFDNSDGVQVGFFDFETVVAHEIGHALGFLSEVDVVDFVLEEGLREEVLVNPLDLFRFSNDEVGADPSNSDEFASYPRMLTPGGDAILDFIVDEAQLKQVEFRVSTGFTQGDGRQASHWKDDAFTGRSLGIMDPSLASGGVASRPVVVPVNRNDLRALDVIGYDILSVPEPKSLLLVACNCLGLLIPRTRL